MTSPTAPHDQMWDELTAGYALDALEPEDEARLLAHLPQCAHCRAMLDEFRLVASQLGSLGDGDVDAPAWERIAPRAVAAGPTVTPLHPRRWQQRALAAAAAVVLLAAGGELTWHYTHGTAQSANEALAACAARPSCSVVRLHSSSGDVAAVVVDGGRASLVPLHLAAPAASRSYALWQLPRDGSPVFLGSFRDPHHRTAQTPLAVAYADTAAFAVSLEPAGVRPQRPTSVIATGAAPA